MINKKKLARKILAPCLVALFILPLTAFADNPHTRPYGDVQTLAPFPVPPGSPEGIAVRGNKAYVSGPARFGTAGQPPSIVVVYDTRTGEQLETIQIQGENLAQEHANSCVAFDGQGRLYVVNTQLGIVRIDLGSGVQTVYASPIPPVAPFNFPLPNDIAFDPAGNLYLTDSFQATIWRIPPGGGAPQVWFQHPALATPFGPNGIRVNPDRTKIYFVVTAEGAGPMGFTGGKIYTLPLVEAPTADDLQVFHQYSGEGPDGIAFGNSGKLYVMLASPGFSGVSVLSPTGAEVARIGNPPGPNFLTTPFNSPANGAFDKHGSLLVTNHTFIFPGNESVLSVYVDDKESPLVKPNVP
ncbi:MAG TPA: SMP-30/gluconolactonase/LRE family protein [Pyrinomonadaceae bacterium]|nr:SMP-30/gluconolactonase/LRE family protein [Pyrinomonadaceae bacterium]